MKKFLTGVNVQAAVLFVVSVAQTVIMALFKPIGAWYIVLLQLCSLAGIAVLRFAPYIALLNNVIHSVFYRRNSSNYEDDEPSELAIFFVKLCGYILFAVQIVMMLVY